MMFSVAVLLGLLLGSVLLVVSRRDSSSAEASRPTWPRWTAFGLGVTAAAFFAVGLAGFTDTAFAILPGIGLPIAGVVFALGRVTSGERVWQTWTGLGLASLPALFWTVFAVAEVFGRRH